MNQKFFASFIVPLLFLLTEGCATYKPAMDKAGPMSINEASKTFIKSAKWGLYLGCQPCFGGGDASSGAIQEIVAGPEKFVVFVKARGEVTEKEFFFKNMPEISVTHPIGGDNDFLNLDANGAMAHTDFISGPTKPLRYLARAMVAYKEAGEKMTDGEFNKSKKQFMRELEDVRGEQDGRGEENRD